MIRNKIGAIRGIRVRAGERCLRGVEMLFAESLVLGTNILLIFNEHTHTTPALVLLILCFYTNKHTRKFILFYFFFG